MSASPPVHETSERWSERAWKGVLFVALLATTWALLRPGVPAIAADLFFFDKLAHIGIFAVLALLSVKAYAAQPRWGIVAGLVFYGLCIEIAQPRTGRTFELLDVVADALGASLVFLLRR